MRFYSTLRQSSAVDRSTWGHLLLQFTQTERGIIDADKVIIIWITNDAYNHQDCSWKYVVQKIKKRQFAWGWIVSTLNFCFRPPLHQQQVIYSETTLSEKKRCDMANYPIHSNYNVKSPKIPLTAILDGRHQSTTGCAKKRPTFDLMYVENDCTYTICFYTVWIFILQLKIWYKAIQNRLKVRLAMANESLNFRTR